MPNVSTFEEVVAKKGYFGPELLECPNPILNFFPQVPQLSKQSEILHERHAFDHLAPQKTKEFSNFPAVSFDFTVHQV